MGEESSDSMGEVLPRLLVPVMERHCTFYPGNHYGSQTSSWLIGIVKDSTGTVNVHCRRSCRAGDKMFSLQRINCDKENYLLIGSTDTLVVSTKDALKECERLREKTGIPLKVISGRRRLSNAQRLAEWMT